MAKYNFNLRKSSSERETAINLIVRWNNNRLMYSTRESIKPKFWETDKEKKNFQRAKETRQFPEYPEFNLRLDHIESTAKSAFRQFQNDNGGRQPSIEELKEILDIKLRDVEVKKKQNLFQFIEQYIEEAKGRTHSKTGKKLSRFTIHMYNRSFETVRDFSSKYKIRTDFDTIDLTWYYQYLNYLTKDLQLANNTAGSRIRDLKIFLNDAVERGLNTNLAFKSKKFKKIVEDTYEIYLTENELLELENLDLSWNQKLDRTRDLFILGCWTGLRYGDFSNLEKQNIHEDYIEVKTRKTGASVIIPIHKSVRKIIEKYKSVTHNSLPPSLSNVVMNRYLKQLGSMIPCLHEDIKKTITKGGVFQEFYKKKYELLKTHTARRSFSSNAYKSGLSTIAIRQITSHKSDVTLMRYIKISPHEHADIVREHWKKQGNI